MECFGMKQCGTEHQEMQYGQKVYLGVLRR